MFRIFAQIFFKVLWLHRLLFYNCFCFSRRLHWLATHFPSIWTRCCLNPFLYHLASLPLEFEDFPIEGNHNLATELRWALTRKFSNSFRHLSQIFLLMFSRVFFSRFTQSAERRKTRELAARILELATPSRRHHIDQRLYMSVRRVFLLVLCTCKTIFFSCYFHRICLHESEVKIFAGLCESLPLNFRWVLRSLKEGTVGAGLGNLLTPGKNRKIFSSRN